MEIDLSNKLNKSWLHPDGKAVMKFPPLEDDEEE